MCSQPTCNSMTVGPADSSPSLVTKRGKASHICAAAPHGPRYDPAQSPEERAGIGNGIWLCSGCADVIDKNGGVDYNVTELRRWKGEHERMVAQLVKSGSSPLRFIRKHTDEGVVAQEIVAFLEGRGALFVDFAFERNEFVVESLREIRAFLTARQVRIDPETPLYSQVRAIADQCRRYMNEMSTQADHALMVQHLGVTRKAIGAIVRGICEQYGVAPGANLASIMPTFL
jgi:hypothetical protein